MRLCVVSFKECWQDDAGTWMSTGGFPAQMAALGALFDEMTLVLTRSQPLVGGIPLPRHAQVVPLRRPVGDDTRRKISVIANAIYYLTSITRHVRSADVVHTPLPGDLPFLGMIVATICCYKGITARGGAEGVARAVHQAVVASFVSIQIFEYLYTPTVLALFHTNNVLR